MIAHLVWQFLGLVYLMLVIGASWDAHKRIQWARRNGYLPPKQGRLSNWRA